MMQRWKSSIAVFVFVIVFDQITKWWALEELGSGRVVEIFWTLQFRLVRNTGIAFSQGEGLGPIFAVLIVIVVLFVVRWGTQMQSKFTPLAVGLIVGGAIGNLIDRAFRSDAGFLKGGVVDFVDLQWWPVFNVADAAIVVGGVMMFWLGLKSAQEVPEDSDTSDSISDLHE
jgi:signal peptidase II